MKEYKEYNPEDDKGLSIDTSPEGIIKKALMIFTISAYVSGKTHLQQFIIPVWGIGLLLILVISIIRAKIISLEQNERQEKYKAD